MVYFQQISSAFLEKAQEILSYMNWVDLVGIIIVMRTLYIGIRKGLLIEIFKSFGLGAGIFVAVTQYRRWGVGLSEKTILPLRGAEIFAFVALFVMVSGAFLLLRFLVAKVATVQIHGVWNRIGGGALGFCRGCMWLIVLEVTALCLTPTTGYITQSIQERSFFGPSLLTGGKVTYQIAHRASTSFTIESFEEILQKGEPR